MLPLTLVLFFFLCTYTSIIHKAFLRHVIFSQLTHQSSFSVCEQNMRSNLYINDMSELAVNTGLSE